MHPFKTLGLTSPPHPTALNIMNMHTPGQIAEIVLKVLQEVNITPNVSKLSTQEKIKLAKDPNATV